MPSPTQCSQHELERARLILVAGGIASEAVFGRRWLVVMPVIVAGALAVGCGTTDEASRQTLPPIRTTTSSSTTSTTIANDRFYTIQQGDTLAVIAAEFRVTVQSIVELNGLANPDDIQAGQTIEIPSNVRGGSATTTKKKKANANQDG